MSRLGREELLSLIATVDGRLAELEDQKYVALVEHAKLLELLDSLVSTVPIEYRLSFETSNSVAILNFRTEPAAEVER